MIFSVFMNVGKLFYKGFKSIISLREYLFIKNQSSRGDRKFYICDCVHYFVGKMWIVKYKWMKIYEYYLLSCNISE